MKIIKKFLAQLLNIAKVRKAKTAYYDENGRPKLLVLGKF